jgi:aminopeptidase N
VNQPGVPVVSVRATCEDDVTIVSLAQQRFFADRTLIGSAPEQTWTIPVCVAEEECFVLDRPAAETRFEGCLEGAFANWKGRGYYLAAYGGDVAAAAADRSAGERLGLLRDHWYLLQVGQLAIAEYLDLVAAIAPAERERQVVDEYVRRLEEIEESLVADADRPAFQAWMRETLRQLADELGWTPRPGEDASTMVLRAAVQTALGMRAADPQVHATARELAEAYLTDPAAVHPTMATTVLEVAAQVGGSALYGRYRTALDAAPSPEEAARLRGALARFPDPELRQRNFELALSDAIRGQDRSGFLGDMASDQAGFVAVWSFRGRGDSRAGRASPGRGAAGGKSRARRCA